MSKQNRYIVSPLYDSVFFIGSPILACILGRLFVEYFKRGYPDAVHLWGNEASLTGILALTQAHLVIVFYRSHGNPQIFRQFPLRFILAPILLFLGIYFSDIGMACAGCLVVWWDVYHTSQQNFGLARIYDARSGNPLPPGRWIEKLAHLVFYAAPIFAGSYLLSHISGCGSLEELNLFSFSPELPKFVEANAEVIRSYTLAVGFLTSAALLIFEMKRYSQGYRYPLPKILIIVSTVTCTIFAWGFNKFGDAYFIVNLYHATQYFAIVWATEKKQKGSFISLLTANFSGIVAFLFFFIPPVLIGTWFEFSTARLSIALLFCCALLHFWYDSFIWSVRKKAV